MSVLKNCMKLMNIFKTKVKKGDTQSNKFFVGCTILWHLYVVMADCGSITETCLYIFTPLNPFLYGKTGVYSLYIIFLVLLKNIDSGYSLQSPRRCGSNEYPHSMF